MSSIVFVPKVFYIRDELKHGVKMTTIEEHLNTLISPIRELALKNRKLAFKNRKEYPYLKVEIGTVRDAIYFGFLWYYTPEGDSFWRAIHANIESFTITQQPEVTPQVIIDLQERSKKGEAEYGTTLRTHNGRNALQDAYEEALDLACYLKQKLMEEG